MLLLALAVIAFFIFRNTLLDKAIARVSEKIERDYNASLTVKESAFRGFSGVELTDIALVPKNADTLLHIETLITEINVSRLFTGDVQLGRLNMKNGYLQFVINKQGKNFDAFLKRAKKENTEEEVKDKGEKKYSEKAYRLLNRVLNLVPTDMKLENLTLRINDMGRKVSLNMQQLSLYDKQLETAIAVNENDSLQVWKVSGMADPRDKVADLKFFNADSSRINVPYIQKRFGIKAGFNTIHVKLDNIDMDGSELHVDGFAAIEDFMVNHEKIASKDVLVENARFDYHFLFGPDFITLDSSSTVMLNKIKVNPFIRYSIENDTTYTLKAKIPKMPAQDFIVSLPKGLFTHFEGMEAQGSFSYSLDFMYNKNKPNDIVFDSSLSKDGFKIVKYGEANLAKLNGEFVYQAIDNGRKQRPVMVGPANPYFTPYELISPYVKDAVLTSEDPSFFSHRGFITEAFKQSIVKNIKTGEFARGASTISMQLVKNVFLTREKTLSRKLEEILLVYILENNRIVSKQRMLEVYFNVIEWGPDVYGIGEAANYYFQKPPILLSVDEAVYLASIVPRPKAFMWGFDSQGDLKDYAVRHDNHIKNIMLRRGLLTAEDTIGQNGKIYISGPARSQLRIKEDIYKDLDTVAVDKLFFDLGKRAY